MRLASKLVQHHLVIFGFEIFSQKFFAIFGNFEGPMSKNYEVKVYLNKIEKVCYDLMPNN